MRLFYYEFGSLAIYIPASHLSDIQRHDIIGMDLFFDNIPTNGTGSIIVYIAEDGDRVVNPSSMRKVVEIGSGVFLSDKTLHIDFDTPYYYTEDNLTILFDWSNDSKYSSNAYMYGHIRLYVEEHDSGSSGGGGYEPDPWEPGFGDYGDGSDSEVWMHNLVCDGDASFFMEGWFIFSMGEMQNFNQEHFYVLRIEIPCSEYMGTVWLVGDMTNWEPNNGYEFIYDEYNMAYILEIPGGYNGEFKIIAENSVISDIGQIYIYTAY